MNTPKYKRILLKLSGEALAPADGSSILDFDFMAKDKELKISHLKKVWENKVDKIEEKILSKVKIDDATYKMMIQYYILNVGFAENAIQYLSDTMYLYGDNIIGTSLVHKRIKNIDSYTLLNPLNFIVDFKGRDLCELLKNDLISIDEFTFFKVIPLVTDTANIILLKKKQV